MATKRICKNCKHARKVKKTKSYKAYTECSVLFDSQEGEIPVREEDHCSMYFEEK